MTTGWLAGAGAAGAGAGHTHNPHSPNTGI